MKKVVLILVGLLTACGSYFAMAQKMDDPRMGQDIEVAENILSTLIRQQFGKRVFLPMDVHGSYTAGFGVTFRLPQSGGFGFMKMPAGDNFDVMFAPEIAPAISYSYSYHSDDRDTEAAEREAKDAARRAADSERRAKDVEREAKDVERKAKDVQRDAQAKSEGRTTILRSGRGVTAVLNRDSLRTVSDARFIEVAKSFLADYGDVLSQLKPEERILITNRGDGFDNFYVWKDQARRASLVSVEAKRDDIIQLRQGKITRDQFLAKLKVINTESSDELDPDLEVFASMFNRLYREDLSKTYYTEGSVNYERMKDFGVIYYMRVYSSVEQDEKRFYLPTVAAGNLNQAERDKKVKELYPAFEASLKDNLLEYGRTLRSLKDDEQIIFNIKLTKCEGCGIPESIEVSVKESVLKDYAASKLSKQDGLAKVSVKKVGVQ